MKHKATSAFWKKYHLLPEHIRRLADRSHAVLKDNPLHPSLHLKKVGRYWSVRVGSHYRALGVEANDDAVVWFWIGSHAEYDRLV